MIFKNKNAVLIHYLSIDLTRDKVMFFFKFIDKKTWGGFVLFHIKIFLNYIELN